MIDAPKARGAVFRLELAIDAPAERAFALLLDRAAWMDSFRTKRIVWGETNVVGELAIISGVYDGQAIDRLEQLVEFVPNERLSYRLATLDDSLTYAFLHSRLHVRAGQAHRLEVLMAGVTPVASPQEAEHMDAWTRDKLARDHAKWAELLAA